MPGLLARLGQGLGKGLADTAQMQLEENRQRRLAEIRRGWQVEDRDLAREQKLEDVETARALQLEDQEKTRELQVEDDELKRKQKIADTEDQQRHEIDKIKLQDSLITERARQNAIAEAKNKGLKIVTVDTSKLDDEGNAIKRSFAYKPDGTVMGYFDGDTGRLISPSEIDAKLQGRFDQMFDKAMQNNPNANPARIAKAILKKAEGTENAFPENFYPQQAIMAEVPKSELVKDDKTTTVTDPQTNIVQEDKDEDKPQAVDFKQPTGRRRGIGAGGTEDKSLTVAEKQKLAKEALKATAPEDLSVFTPSQLDQIQEDFKTSVSNSKRNTNSTRERRRVLGLIEQLEMAGQAKPIDSIMAGQGQLPSSAVPGFDPQQATTANRQDFDPNTDYTQEEIQDYKQALAEAKSAAEKAEINAAWQDGAFRRAV